MRCLPAAGSMAASSTAASSCRDGYAAALLVPWHLCIALGSITIAAPLRLASCCVALNQACSDNAVLKYPFLQHLRQTGGNAEVACGCNDHMLDRLLHGHA